MLLNTRIAIPNTELTSSNAMLIFFLVLFFDKAALRKTVDRMTALAVNSRPRICFVDKVDE